MGHLDITATTMVSVTMVVTTRVFKALVHRSTITVVDNDLISL